MIIVPNKDEEGMPEDLKNKIFQKIEKKCENSDKLLRFQLPHRFWVQTRWWQSVLCGRRVTWHFVQRTNNPLHSTFHKSNLISFWHRVLSNFWNSLKLLKYAKILALQNFLQKWSFSRVFKFDHLFSINCIDIKKITFIVGHFLTELKNKHLFFFLQT